MCVAMLYDHHEPSEYGQREIRACSRRLHPSTYICPYQGQPTLSTINHTVCEQLLRESTRRGGAVLVDAVLFSSWVHQDHGLFHLDDKFTFMDSCFQTRGSQSIFLHWLRNRRIDATPRDQRALWCDVAVVCIASMRKLGPGSGMLFLDAWTWSLVPVTRRRMTRWISNAKVLSVLV